MRRVQLRRGLRFAEDIGVYTVRVLIMDASDFICRCHEDIQQLRVEVFATVLEHELNRMVEFEGRLVDSLSGECVKRVGNRGNASFDRNGLAL